MCLNATFACNLIAPVTFGSHRILPPTPIQVSISFGVRSLKHRRRHRRHHHCHRHNCCCWWCHDDRRNASINDDTFNIYLSYFLVIRIHLASVGSFSLAFASSFTAALKFYITEKHTNDNENEIERDISWKNGLICAIGLFRLPFALCFNVWLMFLISYGVFESNDREHSVFSFRCAENGLHLSLHFDFNRLQLPDFLWWCV